MLPPKHAWNMGTVEAEDPELARKEVSAGDLSAFC